MSNEGWVQVLLSPMRGAYRCSLALRGAGASAAVSSRGVGSGVSVS